MTNEDLPLFNYIAAPHNGTDTSREAADSIVQQVNGMCREVLNAIRESEDGLTCDEVEELLNMKHQTASARINDLANSTPAFIVKKQDEQGAFIKRANRSRRKAFVWFAA